MRSVAKRLKPMPIDPKGVPAANQRALNDAAGKASVLWSTFVLFQLYLAIAFGSVTHRDLFLETPIKMPLLNVELSLVGFFVVAPMVLIIFHFYICLQLLGLASKAKDYNTLLSSELDHSDRQYLRQRLDVFPILQFLAGPKKSADRLPRLLAAANRVDYARWSADTHFVARTGDVSTLPREWIVWLQRVRRARRSHDRLVLLGFPSQLS